MCNPTKKVVCAEKDLHSKAKCDKISISKKKEIQTNGY